MKIQDKVKKVNPYFKQNIVLRYRLQNVPIILKVCLNFETLSSSQKKNETADPQIWFF